MSPIRPRFRRHAVALSDEDLAARREAAALLTRLGRRTWLIAGGWGCAVAGLALALVLSN